jgi:hypothetical protein
LLKKTLMVKKWTYDHPKRQYIIQHVHHINVHHQNSLTLNHHLLLFDKEKMFSTIYWIFDNILAIIQRNNISSNMYITSKYITKIFQHWTTTYYYLIKKYFFDNTLDFRQCLGDNQSSVIYYPPWEIEPGTNPIYVRLGLLKIGKKIMACDQLLVVQFYTTCGIEKYTVAILDHIVLVKNATHINIYTSY